MVVQLIQLTSWGTNLRRIRRAQGLTLEQLATTAGISKSRLSQIESGTNDNVSLQHLLGLQHALKLDTLEALLGDTPSAHLANVRGGSRRP